MSLDSPSGAGSKQHGYIEGSKAKAIRKLVNRLCGEVREQAVPLVSAFGIPDELLAAPIALERGRDPA